MIGHVPKIVFKEFLNCYVEDNGDYFITIYEGRGGSYEEAVGYPTTRRITRWRLMD
jgi:hypothetical protein